MTDTPLDKRVLLRPKEDFRIRAGHPWVFSNEVREVQGAPLAGDLVEVHAANGALLGVGLYHPHSLIAVRLVSRIREPVDGEFFRRRIARALELRTMLFPGETVYRLVHGEADFLPGLAIDRFNEAVVVQTFSFGMDQRLPVICDALDALLHPASIIERNESPLRTLEQLPARHGILRGSTAATTIVEHGIAYGLDLREGQKSGFFLDQRENRLTVRRFSKGARVLDLFCNDGGFALNAAYAGAADVLGIDASAEAVARATANATRNGLTVARFEQYDAFDVLPVLAREERTYDVIVLDPPSFTRSRKNVQTAKKGYRDLHLGALKLLRKGGILLTASCSHHITSETFLETVDDAVHRTGKSAQLLEWRGASPDHPTLPGVPETRYLKFGIFRIA
jgi:23S rRNA (cytosine1962-C5)-methyltransferase